MTPDEVLRVLVFLKRNGAWIEMDPDTEDMWGFALRSFTPDMVKAGCLWFLERNHPREVSPATIRAAVNSLAASGRFRQDMCPDHPEEVARWCRCCLADKLAGDRPPELVGKRMLPVGGSVRPEVMHQIERLGGLD